MPNRTEQLEIDFGQSAQSKLRLVIVMTPQKKRFDENGIVSIWLAIPADN